MRTIDTVCPYCCAETMQETVNAFGGTVEQCLDCGYTREREPETTQDASQEAA
jgi:hypothetical protein